MKLLYCVLFYSVIFLPVCYSQKSDSNVIRIDALPASGLLLEKGWKFQAGDDPDYAKTGFDDKDWLNINIDQPVSQLPEKPLQKMSWYRLRFTLDSLFKDTLAALVVDQYGASEIYIDGHLIQKFGKVISTEKFISFNPHDQPLPVILSNTSDHVIAIRLLYSIPSSSMILKQISIPPLSIRLQPLALAIAAYEKVLKESRIETGRSFVNLVFCLLFLLLFLFYPRRPLYLFFSLFHLSHLLQVVIARFLQEGQYSFNTLFLLNKANDLLSWAGTIIILLFMLIALFNRVKPIFRWFMALIVMVDLSTSILFPKTSLISDSVQAIYMFILLGLAFYAFRSKKRENWLIGFMASSLFFSNFSFFIFLTTKYNLYGTEIITPVIVNLSMLTYLSLNYARTNKSLEQQLVQIKNLSEENLRREQEKQQLLASQNEILEQQVKQRTSELNNSLNELKSTQAQLIQQEKMASLGELTAGIAHEIQNPLNFVNNFSEVNGELIKELKREVSTGNMQEVTAIADDIESNSEKINHHGKRADAIVKGMLQHSRTGSGIKEASDVNRLADEYLRLAYHGFKEKNKPFEAKIESDFDSSVGKINVVPQDIGRALLNLINNAFYAVNERRKQNLNGYEPTVSVTTRKYNGKVEIRVEDNGTGIPQSILDKVFQPFFTTKPTGQGTGLGLSLAYDIVKAHGGEIKVATKEGEGSEFIIQLPLSSQS
jgi:two-component system NtrC family sensor kinase